MTEFQVRTDLALEARERFEEDVEIRGVAVEESYDERRDIRVTVVRIQTENGAKAMGKPIGTYITLEAPRMSEPDEDYHREVSVQLAEVLKSLLPRKEVPVSVLVAGLGNREVTPDALGPRVVDNMMITRHILKEFGKYAFGQEEISPISGIVPGVMAQTGMESMEILKGVIQETKPECIIAVDALAARSVRRLGVTIQLSDAGIHPGSGVGNHRNSLTRETLGVPVIAIGVPTVVGAAAIVHDTVGALVAALKEGGEAGYGDMVEHMDGRDQYQLIREVLEPQIGPMYVTPHNIDERVENLSFTISEAIHMALFGGNG